MVERKKVIVDTDFMAYMIRSRDNKTEYYFEKIMDDLHLEAIVHEFLYKNEMFNNEVVKQLESTGRLKIINYGDFLNDIESKEYYRELFKELYKYCNGENVEFEKCDFDTYRESDANLGEIHSVLLALFTGYDLFFSNDKGSKAMVDVKINNADFHIEVKNIVDVLKEIALLEDKTMTKKDLISLTKGDKGRKESLNEIRAIWK